MQRIIYFLGWLLLLQIGVRFLMAIFAGHTTDFPDSNTIMRLGRTLDNNLVQFVVALIAVYIGRNK